MSICSSSTCHCAWYSQSFAWKMLLFLDKFSILCIILEYFTCYLTNSYCSQCIDFSQHSTVKSSVNVINGKGGGGPQPNSPLTHYAWEDSNTVLIYSNLCINLDPNSRGMRLILVHCALFLFITNIYSIFYSVVWRMHTHIHHCPLSLAFTYSRARVHNLFWHTSSDRATCGSHSKRLT